MKFLPSLKHWPILSVEILSIIFILFNNYYFILLASLSWDPPQFKIEKPVITV